MNKTVSLRTCALVCLTVAILCLPASGARKGRAKARANPILGQATYKGLEAGQFMTKWLVLGLIPVGQDESAGQSEPEQKKAFGTDPLSLERFQVVEKVSGKPLDEYLKQTFFGPLGMEDTGMHRWGLHGFVTYLMQIPEKKLTVTVLSNCAPALPELAVSERASRIAEVYLFEEMEAQASFTVDKTVDPAVFDDYLGRYDYGNRAVLTVTKENGRLLAQLTGQGALEILPRAQDEFFWKEVDAQITFVRDGQGHVTGGIHHQGGQTLNVPKLKEEAIAQLDPALYDLYVGEYKLENVGIMKVLREDAHLYVQVTGQPRAEIFPRTATEFFLKIVQANITFTKDSDGKVASLTLKQSGLTLTGPKLK